MAFDSLKEWVQLLQRKLLSQILLWLGLHISLIVVRGIFTIDLSQCSAYCLHQPPLWRFKACLIGADMDVAQDLLLVLLQHFQDSFSANVVEKHVPGGVSISHSQAWTWPSPRFPTSSSPSFQNFSKIRWVPKTLSSVKVTEFPNDKSTWVWAAKCITVSISCISGLWCENGRHGREEYMMKLANMSRFEIFSICHAIRCSNATPPKKKHAETTSDLFLRLMVMAIEP